jgi:hypothetical protein
MTRRFLSGVFRGVYILHECVRAADVRNASVTAVDRYVTDTSYNHRIDAGSGEIGVCDSSVHSIVMKRLPDTGRTDHGCRLRGETCRRDFVRAVFVQANGLPQFVIVVRARKLMQNSFVAPNIQRMCASAA